MEIIVSAKDRQAAEANKNASILLEELDLEKSREESKKLAAARKREKKRRKKKEKQEKEKEKEREEQKDEPRLVKLLNFKKQYGLLTDWKMSFFCETYQQFWSRA